MNQRVPGFSRVQAATLRRLASKYLWWKTPEEALQRPERIMVQVMDIGDHDDVLALWHEAGDEGLKRVLQNAGPGELTPRSWNYWHVRLGLALPGEAPPMPVRRIE